MISEIAPRSGAAFRLAKGQRLKVIDPQGEQVSDLLAFNAEDTGEVIFGPVARLRQQDLPDHGRHDLLQPQQRETRSQQWRV